MPRDAEAGADALKPPLRRFAIRVSGLVQGVGFRPHVHRTATGRGVAGFVLNDAEGVLIEAEGADLEGFLAALRREAPRLARIERIRAEPIAPIGERGFTIRESRAGGAGGAAVPADAGVCAACLAEMFDPNDRRYLHPFVSCADCGPRYTITERLPYDRAQTSMAGFELCPNCAAEYADPASRRFHAEPIACRDCGPKLDMPIEAIAARLGRGEIVAIKGLGGFHLVCDARNPAAVARLRRAKRRDAKPFAVMVLNLASAARIAELSPPAAESLESVARPIVILDTRPDAGLASEVCDGLPTVGLMLPYTPVHYLVFHALLGRPSGRAFLEAACAPALVATSANLSGDPLVIDDAEAAERLGGVADAVAGHAQGASRRIVTRADDGVLRIVAGAPSIVRRGRGQAPQPIALAAPMPTTLALGGHLKTTVTVVRGDQAFVSQHVGDLDNPSTVAALEATVRHLLAITETTPERVACDLHPDFASTRLAQAIAERLGAVLVPVQHHHAHIAAILAEHRVQGPALGLAFDGYGFGLDGAAWGGELLAVDGPQMDRLGGLAPLAQPGADRAAREPWRMAAAALHRLGRGAEIAARFPDEPQAAAIAQLLASGLAPQTTSAGRLFDAAAGLLGIARRARFEGEPAMRLEGLARRPRALAGGWRLTGDGGLDLDPLLAALEAEAAPVAGAELFHGTLAAAAADWVGRAAETTGLRHVALGGGCFLNRRLTEDLARRLTARGLTPLLARRLPPNDGGLSFGQAMVAAATPRARRRLAPDEIKETAPMCLAVPAQLLAVIDADRAKAAIGGVVREICISLIEDPKPGEFVILHVGYALSKMDEAEAARTLAVMREDGSLAELIEEFA